MSLSHEAKFRRAVYHASLVYGKYMHRSEIRSFAQDLAGPLGEDWFFGVIALKHVIAEYDVMPTEGDMFVAILNLKDDPDNSAWAIAGDEEEAFYEIKRPVHTATIKTMPGEINV